MTSEQINLHDNLDAKVRADEFMCLFGDRRNEIDHELMQALFANAIMAGYDLAEKRQRDKVSRVKGTSKYSTGDEQEVSANE